VVPQLGLIALGQRSILLLLLEIYNAITLGAGVVLTKKVHTCGFSIVFILKRQLRLNKDEMRENTT
jgi:hypothetical protein